MKARPKWDRLSKKMVTDIPLELYGDWQVKARLRILAPNRLSRYFIPSILIDSAFLTIWSANSYFMKLTVR